MSINKEEIENTIYELYSAIRQAESMVHVITSSELFQSSAINKDVESVHDVLDVCGAKINQVQNLFEKCERYLNELTDQASESESTLLAMNKLKIIIDAQTIPV